MFIAVRKRSNRHSTSRRKDKTGSVSESSRGDGGWASRIGLKIGWAVDQNEVEENNSWICRVLV